MATLFSCTFPTLKGDTYRVNIDDSAYGGAATDIELEFGGFNLRYEGDPRDMFAPLLPSKCTVRVAVSDDTLADMEQFALDLIESGENRFTVRIDEKPAGGSFSLYWVGHVLPDLSGFSDIDPPYRFAITAIDGLGRLKKTDYAQTPVLPYGAKTVLDHILTAIQKDNTLPALYYATDDIFLTTSVNWQDSNIGTPAAAKCPLPNTMFTGYVFSDKEESATAGTKYKHSSTYEALEQIMRHFAARMYYAQGAWRIEQINERSQDTFYQRRFKKNGTLISSTATQANDVSVMNAGANNRLAGGVFGYIPALKSVTANYLHDTGGNRLEGASGFWSSLSPFAPLETFFNVSLSSDNIFRISGNLNCEIELDAAYVKPWRYKFRMYLAVNGYTLDGISTNMQIGGNYTTVLDPIVPTWNNVGTNYYEISTAFCYGTLLNETISFSFDTPPLPTGTSFSMAFYTYLADTVDNDGEAATVNFWTVTQPSLLVRSAADPNANYETERRYTVENTITGNSETLEQDFLFGHPISGATIGGIYTSPNTGVFSITTDTWDAATETENYEFPQLWAAEIMSARSKARSVYSGTIQAARVFANTRVVLPINGLTGWLFLGGEFEATNNIWTGDWFEAGVDRTTIDTSAPPIKIGGPVRKKRINPKQPPQLGPLVPPGSVQHDGGFLSLGGFTGVSMMALTTNTINGAVAAGTITSIPLRYAVNALDYVAGDDIMIVNPTTGEIIPLTVSTTSDSGDTSLAVNSATVPNIPSGALLLYGPLNKYTQQGGTRSNIPPGTAQGQVLRWNNVDDVWEVYSGTTDGHVLTWDTTNGWQAEAGASGGINDGDTLSTGLTFPNAGLHILDTNATHDLIISPGSNLTADRTLTVTTGDADRTLTIGGNATLNGGTMTSGTHSGTNTGDQTITLTGDVTGSGTGSFAATIANDAVTYAKIQNVTDARLLGRSAGSAGDVQEITVGTGLLLSGGALTNTVTAGVTGTGVANRIAYWTGTSTLSSDDAPLWWDATNNRIGIGTSSPAAGVHIGLSTGTSDEGLRVLANLSANLNNTISNVNNANAAANAILNIIVGGSSAGDPMLQLGVSGAITASIGLDNSDGDKIKIKHQSTPSTGSNVGLTLTNTSPQRLGVNTDAPGYEIDNANTTRSRTFINTSAVPTVTPGTGMGTTPSGIAVLGGQNAVYYAFTTGTTPTNNATIFTVTPATAYPTIIIPTFSAGNAQTATDISKFYISSAGNTSFTVTANGTLSASTAYVLRFSIFGY